VGTRGRTVHGDPANAGHRVLAPDDLEVEAYLEQALHGPMERVTDQPPDPQTIIVLDFGGQYAQLIARRIRELNVYSVLLPHDTPWEEIERRRPVGIILSPAVGAVLMSLSTVIVALNAQLLRRTELSTQAA